ncbi:MAG: hypothetical protein KKA73_10925 [Chloroflexi bacterium]|nr:hypothetical protein [Chloroflexota bacterium]MBU1748189.1 hypothetical protein [Chloroflexota bacterium]MBU1880242.1 hypothetical protein [Chloroflexota bacterium]
MQHLYLCPACGRTFDDETIPTHRACPYDGPGQRLTFTLAEARQGIAVAVLRAYTDGEAARRGRAAGKPRFTVSHIQIEEGR